MEQEIAELRGKLAEVERSLEENQRLLEKERLYEEKQVRRKAAEAKVRPTNLAEYLDACHRFSLALRVVTDKTLITRGNALIPSVRPFPQRIVPWDNFSVIQEEVWDKVSMNDCFTSQRVFPSVHQLDYVLKYLRLISSDFAIQNYARETVEYPVEILLRELCKDEQLREQFHFHGSVVFEGDLKLGEVEVEAEGISTTSTNSSEVAPVGIGAGGKQQGRQHCATKRASKWRAREADQFCIYQLSGGQKVPAVSIEYKVPHKFPLVRIIDGLVGEIWPAELINKESNDPAFLSKYLVATAIIQHFAAMLGKGVRSGYIFTGEAIIFLHIPEDPTLVYYHLLVPRVDVEDSDDNRLYRTTVAQISAFILAAVAIEPPDQLWHDAAERLTAGCKPPKNDIHFDGNDEGNSKSDNSDISPSPTPRRRGDISGQDNIETPPRLRIEHRPYCTHKCLLGLSSGGAIDDQCPNLKDHQETHLQPSTFRRLICIQLAEDRGPNADCKPLYVKGSRGALLKIRLSSHGYTLIAKAMKQADYQHLRQEAKVYNKLCSIQGSFIPVCLGTVDLVLPYYYDCGVYESMLFLSWAGSPLFHYLTPENEVHMLDSMNNILRELHKHQVLHKDAELRNWLWDEQHASLMLVDFERAEIRARLPLNTTARNQKRNQQGEIKIKEDEFDREIRNVRY